MVTFVFLDRIQLTDEKPIYSVGILGESDNELMTIPDASPEIIKELIDAIPTKCIFVGIELRSKVLQPLMIDFCRSKIKLPKGLVIHWVAPYNLNFDDIVWLYNYGVYKEHACSLEFMCESLGIELTGNRLVDIANLYFNLVGDFRIIKQ